MSICEVTDCSRKVLAKNLCGKHYQKLAKYGDPLASGPALKLASRFWSKVDKSGECWEWTASLAGNGYGQFRTGGRIGRPEPAHRVAYKLTHGDIPEGLHIDHRCHNPICVNPSHLRPATVSQNLENRAGANVNSRTGVRGVRLTSSGRYAVSASSRGVLYRAGVYDSLEEAEQAAINLRNQIFTYNDMDRVAS